MSTAAVPANSCFFNSNHPDLFFPGDEELFLFLCLIVVDYIDHTRPDTNHDQNQHQIEQNNLLKQITQHTAHKGAAQQEYRQQHPPNMIHSLPPLHALGSGIDEGSDLVQGIGHHLHNAVGSGTGRSRNGHHANGTVLDDQEANGIDVQTAAHAAAEGKFPSLGINYGRTWAAIGNLQPYLERIFVIKKRKIEVECDFLASQTLITARLDLTITLGRIIGTVVFYGVKALIQFLKINKKRKGGAAK